MSLKVWLPLDGDLRNLGASNVEVTNNGATINNSGKIGSCYHFGTTTSSMSVSKEAMTSCTTECSVTFWLKIKTWNTSYATYFQAGLGGTPWTHYIFGFLRNATGNTACFTISNGSSASNAGYLTSTLELNKWYHIALTYKTGKCAIYLNGILDHEYSPYLVPAFSSITHITLGTCNNGTGYQTDCDMNDFRIYDHCLSAAKVHEIAQGLVLHYKLDSMKIKVGTNLVTGVTKGGHTTVLTDGRIGVQTTGENADTYFTINLSESITNGTKYFLSCDASGIPNNGYWYFPLGTQNNSTLPFKIYNGHNEYSFVANDISWGKKRLFMDDNNRQYWNSQASFWNFELYKAPALEVEDSSGYGHHATLTNGSLTTNTPRYSTALILSSSTKAIGTPIFESGVFIPEYTWAGWIKRNYTTAATKQIHANIATVNLYTDFSPYLSWTSGKVDGSTTGNGAAGGTKIATLNEWVHMAITYKSGIGKFYINGELIKTWNYTSQGVYIAAAANNTLGNGFIGNLSDIRIYTTTLSDTEIKLLCQMGMRVDNLQNIHSYEFNETQSNIFRSELIKPFAKSGATTGIGEITNRNDEPAIVLRQAPFEQNLENNKSGFLQGYFAPNTSYIFDIWEDTDDVMSQDHFAGGFMIDYTDGTSKATFVVEGGNKGFQHIQFITPATKSIDRLDVFGSSNVYYKLNSYICPVGALKIMKNGIFVTSNLIEDGNAALHESGIAHSNEFIEI